MMDGFSTVLAWLREERDIYQTRKFDYVAEANRPVEYWMQQLDSYMQRLPVFEIDNPLGFQAALKLAATAVALCEHLADKMPLPAPGHSSGEIQEWQR